VWGVEWRVVRHDGAFIIPMINLLKKPQTVSVALERGEHEAVDLLTRKIISLKQLELEPMKPLLLKVGWR
jgi:hypothetical protein